MNPPADPGWLWDMADLAGHEERTPWLIQNPGLGTPRGCVFIILDVTPRPPHMEAGPGYLRVRGHVEENQGPSQLSAHCQHEAPSSQVTCQQRSHTRAGSAGTSGEVRSHPQNCEKELSLPPVFFLFTSQYFSV